MPIKKATPAKALSKATKPAPKTKVVETRVKMTGKNTRVKGHLSASTRKAQAKRDGKN